MLRRTRGRSGMDNSSFLEKCGQILIAELCAIVGVEPEDHVFDL